MAKVVRKRSQSTRYNHHVSVRWHRGRTRFDVEFHGHVHSSLCDSPNRHIPAQGLYSNPPLTTRIHANASGIDLNEHLATCTSLVSESIASGNKVTEVEKCEKFLLSLDDSFDALKFQFELLPDVSQNWTTLVRLFKALADRRSLESEQAAIVTATINKNAIFDKSNMKKTQSSGDRGAKTNQKQRTQSSGNTAGKPRFCSHCGNKGHVIEDCFKEKNGEPSRQELRDAAIFLKRKKDKSGLVNSAISNGWINPEISTVQAQISSVILPISAFLIDSGATHHLVSNKLLLSSITPLPVPLRFGLANTDARLAAKSKGIITVTLSTGENLKLHNVYYVPEARMNILSQGQREMGGK